MQFFKNSSVKPAKFKFRNIGPIKNAELELGDLTIIAGRNNTGKTYLTYTLHGFLKTWLHSPFTRHFLMDERADDLIDNKIRFPHIQSLAKKIMHEGRGKLSLNVDDLNKQREAIIEFITKNFSNYELADVFSSSRSNFRKSSISIELDNRITQFPEQRIETPGGEYSMQYKNEILVVSVKYIQIEKRPRIRNVMPILSSLYLRFLFPELSLSPFILSAERFGISLFYRELDFTKNQLVDLLQKMGDKEQKKISPFFIIERSTSRYAMPIKDNIDYTRSIPDLKGHNSEIHEAKLFDDIKNVMGGYYNVSSDGDIRFIATGRGKNRFDIPLYQASSSARGLSDLYFFLRHTAKPEHLLIIDEPESHLDTNNQCEMARLLGRIVRTGLKVLINTHSDYLIKEVNNLIMLDELNDEKISKKLRYAPDDRIDPQSVRAYVAEKKGLAPCTIDKFGIDMPVFDKTIDEINQTSNELSARITQQEEK